MVTWKIVRVSDVSILSNIYIYIEREREREREREKEKARLFGYKFTFICNDVVLILNLIL